MSAYVTCPLKRNGFYPMYIWRHNLVHREDSFDVLFFFCTKWDLRILNSSAKSMNRELSFVVRAQFWRGRTKELAVLVNRIFPTLLAAWSRQQYPCTWLKLSFTVLISQSDKKKEYFKFYFDRSILLPDGVDSSVAFLGAIRLALIACPPKYDNTQ